MHEKGLSLTLIYDPKNIYYLTGFYPHSKVYLIISESEVILLTSSLEYEAANQFAKGCTIIKAGKGETLENKVVKTLEKFGDHLKLGFESEKFTVKEYTFFKKKLTRVKFTPVDNVLKELRRVKDDTEVSKIKRATRIAEEGIKAALNNLRPGVTEIELAGEVEYAMRSAGSEGFAFETIIASGPNSALPHFTCSRRKLRYGDFVVVDIGGIFEGYCSDLTRTFLLPPFKKKQLELIETVIDAQNIALTLMRSGAYLKEIDLAARNFITQKGLGEFFVHSLGHGVGLDVHEEPVISYKSKGKLVAGDVVTNEPGIYIPGFGGVRIEDMCLVTENKAIELTSIPKRL